MHTREYIPLLIISVQNVITNQMAYFSNHISYVCHSFNQQIIQMIIAIVILFLFL